MFRINRAARPVPLRRRVAITIAALVALSLSAATAPVQAHAAADSDITLATMAGNYQQQYVGHRFGEDLEVLVQNHGEVNYGPVANAPVTFTVTSGSASFPGSGSSVVATTDSNGLALSPAVIAGATPGRW